MSNSQTATRNYRPASNSAPRYSARAKANTSGWSGKRFGRESDHKFSTAPAATYWTAEELAEMA